MMNTLIRIIQAHLSEKAREAAQRGQFLAATDIEASVDEFLALPTYREVDRDRLIGALQERFTVRAADHNILGDNTDHQAWLGQERRAGMDWKFWRRYEEHLAASVPPDSITSVDNITRDILERLEDPLRQGSWDRRGLVVGNVQSGKTANYCGLVCKAVDAGYKVIIVLAGIHKSLRSQTQIRLEEGFLGYMNAENGRRPVGVGLLDSSLRANTGTGRADNANFNLGVARQFGIAPGGMPLLFVVTKTVSTLNNVISWIQSYANAQEGDRKFVRGVPALVIDDESDLASVDIKEQSFDEDGNADPDHDPTKTNACIRRLLRSFEQVAYVGYTATPFANIYIHDKGATSELGDDLFPRSFIVNIPPPTNYMGPARVFGISDDADVGLEESPGLPIIRDVSDHAETDAVDETRGWMPPKLLHRTAHRPLYNNTEKIPPSLFKALLAFILATAVRRIREPGPRLNSMLVHVVRYTAVQKRVARQVEEALANIRRRVRYGDGDAVPTIWDELQQLFKEDFVPTSCACSEITGSDAFELPSWGEVQTRILEVCESIRVKVINGTAGDILDYEAHRDTGLDVIAIGGDKLSRGLTLEGLTVSYFLRASRMYDTLMQMGRWFGYRDQYMDVCRLYTTKELVEWFAHVAVASEELRRDFDYMVNIGATPKEFGLKVRSHPLMLVTSAVKMRHGSEMRLSYSGDISETIIFKTDEAWLSANKQAAENFLRQLGDPKEGGIVGGYVWKTNPAAVIEFLNHYQSHEDGRRADTRLLSRYIAAQVQNGELSDWTIKLVSSGDATAHACSVSSLQVGMIRRSPFPHDQQRTGSYRIRQLMSPPDEWIDLKDEEKAAALAATVRNWQADTRRNKRQECPTVMGRREARAARDKSRAVLLLYPLDPRERGLPDKFPPVVGLAISFPQSDTAKDITYTVTNIFRERGGDDESH
jgi:hypothetical protein